MSCRDWLRNIAVRGCLIAAIVFLSISGLAQNRESDKQPEASPAQQAQPKADQPFPVTVVGPISLEREKTVEPDWNKSECGTAQSHDEADLCEQRRMAKAAEEAVSWASAQTWIAGLGFSAVVVSLFFTGWAANAASRAAKAAEKAIIVENRPWIRLTPKIASDFRVHKNGAEIQCQIIYQNVGKGPAHRIMIDVGELDFGAPDLRGDLAKWIAERVRSYPTIVVDDETMFPGDVYGRRVVARMSKDILDKPPMIEGKKIASPVFAFGAFYHSTINDDVFYTVAAYMIGGISDVGGFQCIFLESDTISAKSLAIERYEGLSKAI